MELQALAGIYKQMNRCCVFLNSGLRKATVDIQEDYLILNMGNSSMYLTAPQ